MIFGFDLLNELREHPVIARVLKNTAYLTAGRAVSRLATFLVLVYLARTFGPEVYGSYSSIVAFIGMFMFISNLGMEEVIIREVSMRRERLQEYVNKLFPFKVLLAFIAISFSLFFLTFSNYSPNFKALAFIYALVLLFSGLSELFRYVFNITERMEIIAAGMLIERFSFAIIAVVLVNTLGGVKAAVAATVLSALFLLAFYFWKSGKFFAFRIENLDWSFFWKIWNPAKWYALSSMISVGYSYLNVIILSQLGTFEEVGFFSAANTLYAGLLIPFAAIQSALLPLSSRQQNRQYFRKLLRRSILFAFLIAFVSLIVSLFAGYTVPLIFGSKYVSAVPVLSIIVWALIPTVLFVWCGQLLVALNMPKTLTFGGLVNAILTIVLSVMLIPQYGAIGAAISFLISTSLGLLVLLYFSMRAFKQL